MVAVSGETDAWTTEIATLPALLLLVMLTYTPQDLLILSGLLLLLPVLFGLAALLAEHRRSRPMVDAMADGPQRERP